MKRIAIVGSKAERRTLLANALSAMTGFEYIVNTPYSIIAYQYNLNLDKSQCQWPDSFVYCLGAFTRRVMTEQQSDESYISDGGS